MRHLLAIAAGGAVGASWRWLMSGAVQRMAGESFPWGTFAVNALGSFALAAANVLGQVAVCLLLTWFGVQLARTI